MKKIVNPFWGQGKSYAQLAADNREETEKFNFEMLSVFTLIGGVLMFFPLMAAPFSNTKMNIIHIYIIGTFIYFTIFLLFKLPAMRKHTLYGLYVIFSIFFLFSIYLSTIHSPHMRATVLLGACCIMPLGFIDRPARMNFFVVFWLIVHTIMAFYLKPRYALDDTINSLCLAILGCFIGNRMIHVRLESYEAYRLLMVEKETDVLTGLFNRRKLFETLADLEMTDAEKPSGILMLDIDYFKEFNDSHGHAAGDRCLEHFGRVLKTFTQNFRMRFYRYGGEEFVALAYGYSEKELLSIAESLRIAVQSGDMNGYKITVSIGAAYCGDEKGLNYENVIDRADKGVYAAKHGGRNRVCLAQG